MNSVIQCLLFSSDFSLMLEEKMKQKSNRKRDLSDAFENLKANMNFGYEKYYDVFQLKKVIERVNPLFEGHQQHDAVECLNTVLAIFNDELDDSPQ